jgi:hypothetical protein
VNGGALPAVPVEDILWLLVDPATYDRLVNRYGWSENRFADWLHETILSQILAPRDACSGP